LLKEGGEFLELRGANFSAAGPGRAIGDANAPDEIAATADNTVTKDLANIVRGKKNGKLSVNLNPRIVEEIGSVFKGKTSSN